MSKRVQITVTLDQKHVDYIRQTADDVYEGNTSQALRNIINAYLNLTK